MYYTRLCKDQPYAKCWKQGQPIKIQRTVFQPTRQFFFIIFFSSFFSETTVQHNKNCIDFGCIHSELFLYSENCCLSTDPTCVVRLIFWKVRFFYQNDRYPERSYDFVLSHTLFSLVRRFDSDICQFADNTGILFPVGPP